MPSIENSALFQASMARRSSTWAAHHRIYPSRKCPNSSNSCWPSAQITTSISSKCLCRKSGWPDMTRKRTPIPIAEKLASALADFPPEQERNVLRAQKVRAQAANRLFTPDHNVLHTHGG